MKRDRLAKIESRWTMGAQTADLGCGSQLAVGPHMNLYEVVVVHDPDNHVISHIRCRRLLAAMFKLLLAACQPRRLCTVSPNS